MKRSLPLVKNPKEGAVTTKRRAAELITDPDAEEIAADDIDGAFTPRLRSGAASLEIEGETVMLVEGTYRLHLLNQLATIVVSCFDGSGTLDELIPDLADAFQADPELVRKDVLEITRQLGRVGLLLGVAEEEPKTHAHGQPEGLMVGEELPSFSLPDLDGRVVAFEDLRGERLLLVNWSPRCGYCKKIAPELAQLQPQLQEHGVRLVLLALGTPEDNRGMLEEHGLDATLLLQDSDEGEYPEFFAGTGTPVAYLVDEQGNAASELTIGADRVPELARSAAGRDGKARRTRGNGKGRSARAGGRPAARRRKPSSSSRAGR
jgi:peroxiredoxin